MFIVKWPSTEFELLKRLWQDTRHLVARLEFETSDELVASARLFEVWRVDAAYAVSTADQRYLREHAQSGPHLMGAEASVRYFPEVSLTKSHVKARQISSLDAQVPVYLVTKQEAAIWTSKNFSGLRFGSVLRHIGTTNHDEAALIVPQSVMGSVVKGENTINEDPTTGNTAYHQLSLGFLVYGREAIADATDFNLTREPICSYGYPQVVVSRRFVEWYVTRELKGWKFRPILEEGNKWHREFADSFSSFMRDWQTGHRENRFSGP
jgi:hypothetical protein